MLDAILVDLEAEGDQLWRAVSGLDDAGWRTPTPAPGWDVATQDVPASTWPRASTPPAWAVLAPTPLPTGEPLRPWQAAVADYLPALLRQHATAVSAGAAS